MAKGWMLRSDGAMHIFQSGLEVDHIDIEEISLIGSRIHRYASRGFKPYPLLQRSVLLAEYMIRREYSETSVLACLLWDAYRVYSPVYASPTLRFCFNNQVEFKGIDSVNNRIKGVIRKAFAIPENKDIMDEISLLNDKICLDEKRCLFPKYKHASPQQWLIFSKPGELGIDISPWTSEETEKKFLKIYNKLS